MLEEYVHRGQERLRCGYTTGSCAAAAAKAAAALLLSGKRTDTVSLMTPKGILLHLELQHCELKQDAAVCAVQKDSGDDPDVTNGIMIYAKAEYAQQGVQIDGGLGIGRVTKPGLDQPVGAAAINSTPRRMIELEVRDQMAQYRYQGGLSVTISAPEGVTIAKKTFNPRLGIVGGISILGTSGIVEPMSSKALIETIRIESNVRSKEGKETLFLTLGNYGNHFLALEMPGLMNQSVKCSNFIGEGIAAGLELGFTGILIIGHIGKLVKLGAGIMNTHSSQADGRMEVLVTCGLLADVDPGLLKRIPHCVTVDEALSMLEEQNALSKTMDQLMVRMQGYLDARVEGRIPIGAVVFSNQFGLLGQTASAPELIKKVRKEYGGQS